MSNKLTGEQVRDKALQVGADLVGIASIDRFKEVPPDKNPVSIFPECKSVIVIGRRVLRGTLRGVEEGTNFSSTYGLFGYRWLEDNFISQTTYDLDIYIESAGWEAVPLFGYSQEGMPKGRKVSPDKPEPNVILDLDYAAQAAGLGEVGLGGFFLTPKYGHRQRFALILTDAELTPDPVFNGKICAECGACVSACPFGAIDPENRIKVGVPGYEREVARVDYEVCRSCPNGAMQAPGRGNRPDRLAAVCARTCMVRLEQAGKCSNEFENDFRKRKPWVVDSFQRSLEVGDDGAPADIGCGKNLDTIGRKS